MSVDTGLIWHFLEARYRSRHLEVHRRSETFWKVYIAQKFLREPLLQICQVSKTFASQFSILGSSPTKTTVLCLFNGWRLEFWCLKKSHFPQFLLTSTMKSENYFCPHFVRPLAQNIQIFCWRTGLCPHFLPKIIFIPWLSGSILASQSGDPTKVI